ncbi:MAG: hypothetical protein ACRDLQ_09025, partial [Solirubrobacterales bacterium]
GQLAVSRVPPAVRVDLVEAATGAAAQTRPVPGRPGAVYPRPGARFDATVRVRRRGDYVIFVGGAFRRRLALSVDGRHVSSRRHRLSHEGHHEPLVQINLTPGSHRLEIRYRRAEPAPGSGGPAFPLGPLYVVQAANPRVEAVPPGRARQLCGRRLDWIESVTP